MHLLFPAEYDLQQLSDMYDGDYKEKSTKLLWLRAIIEKVGVKQNIIGMEELCNIMIATAFPLIVNEKLHFEENSPIQRAVGVLQSEIGGEVPENRKAFIEEIASCQDTELTECRKLILRRIPYRFQSPFLRSLNGKDAGVSLDALLEYVNSAENVMYHFTDDEKIEIQEPWMAYIFLNRTILKKWIDVNAVLYLKKMNPSMDIAVDIFH